MHVKVKEFVHDVKRKLSKKHRRGSTCSTCAGDNYDGNSTYSSTDTLSTMNDAAMSSSAASSLPASPQRRRFISFRRPHTPSFPLKEHDSVLHKVRRVGSKRFRLFSAPSTPSMRVAGVDTPQSSCGQSLLAPATETTINGFAWESQSIQGGTVTFRSSQEDFPDVLDISARSVNIDSTVSEESALCDSFALSDSVTLVTAASREFVSDSDSRFDLVNSHSDESVVFSAQSMAQDPDIPPAPPPKAEQSVVAAADDDEITLAQSTTSLPVPSPPSPVVPQASRAIAPAQLTSPTPASPAPVYIPRLTAPSMFLPIPNVRFIFPLSHPLVWWLEPRWSSTTRPSSSVSTFWPHSNNLASPHPARSHLHFPPLHIQISSHHHHPFLYIYLFCISTLTNLLHFQTDPLSALLTKYVPAEQRPRRDVVGEYSGRDIYDMVVSGLRKVSSVFPERTSTFSSIHRIISRYLHLSHTHSHYSCVSRICIRSFIILLSVSILLSVRAPTSHSWRGWRSLSVLYPLIVAK